MPSIEWGTIFAYSIKTGVIKYAWTIGSTIIACNKRMSSGLGELTDIAYKIITNILEIMASEEKTCKGTFSIENS